jgi:hypothetical protein
MRRATTTIADEMGLPPSSNDFALILHPGFREAAIAGAFRLARHPSLSFGIESRIVTPSDFQS